MANEWTCPYCNKDQIVTDNYSSRSDRFQHGKSSEKVYGFQLSSILCANINCKKITLGATIAEVNVNDYGQFIDIRNDNILFNQSILPQGSAKPQPSVIPKPLIDDYVEACLIRDLSPKASATLIRRCLQGMIHDFCGIAKGTLAKEIDALRAAIADGTADRSIAIESVDAIDHVRGIGNIGAHMEKDIDHIVPVDPGEAQALIDLVEMLFEEWYVARENRQNHLAKIANIAGAKKDIRQAPSYAAIPDK